MIKPSAFLLVKTDGNSSVVLSNIINNGSILWAKAVYGPYQIVVYLEADNELEMVKTIENLRGMEGIKEIDARRVKIIPKDEELTTFSITKPVSAVLLINVNYKEEKERVVTWNLRAVNGVVYSRAMWGPTDIVAIVEADDHEAMRNLICDDIKVLKGVRENSTMYCYPEA